MLLQLDHPRAMFEACDHLWQRIGSRAIPFWTDFKDPTVAPGGYWTNIGTSEDFYCSRDPRHRLRLPNQEEEAEMIRKAQAKRG